jgi:hypothetical protein
MILGIAGPAGAGKDTVADFLVRNHGFTKMSFAGPLKEMLAVAGFPEPADRALKEALVPGFDFSWRQAAQQLGTEWGRGLDPDIWIKIVEKRIRHLLDDNIRQPRIVISDVRFNNESKMIHDFIGSVIHLTGRKADLAGTTAAHASESKLMFWPSMDEIIENDGTPEELYLKVHALVKERL